MYYATFYNAIALIINLLLNKNYLCVLNANFQHFKIRIN